MISSKRFLQPFLLVPPYYFFSPVWVRQDGIFMNIWQLLGSDNVCLHILGMAIVNPRSRNQDLTAQSATPLQGWQKTLNLLLYSLSDSLTASSTEFTWIGRPISPYPLRGPELGGMLNQAMGFGVFLTYAPLQLIESSHRIRAPSGG